MKMSFKNCNVITMEEFILNYLNVNSNQDISHINHYDISKLNIDGIKRIPNEIVSEDDVRTGRVILVESSGFKHKGKMVCAYLRPDLVLYNDNMSDLDKMIVNSLYKDDCKRLSKRKYG